MPLIEPQSIFSPQHSDAANEPIILLKTAKDRRLDSLILNLSYCSNFPELGFLLIKYYLSHSYIAIDYFSKKTAEDSMNRAELLTLSEKNSIKKLQRTFDVDKLTNEIQALFPLRQQTVVNTTQMLIEFGVCFNIMLNGRRVPNYISVEDLMSKILITMLEECSHLLA